MNVEAILARSRHTRRTVVMAVAVAGLSLGCATTDQPIEALERAEAEYADARTTARIDEFANQAMQQAQRNLRRARSLAEEGEDRDAIEHHAFLAEHYVEIAQARLNRGLVQEEIQNADRRRQELLLAAERRESQRSQARATAAETQLAQTREELEQTQQAAQSLASELDELKVQQEERGTVFTLSDVVFDFNSAELNRGGERSVERIAETLQKNPEGQIVIEGYTDAVGSESYNEDLSERRAKAVKQIFMNQGIPEERLRVEGYGEKYPVANNETDQGRQMNRRVEIVVAPEGAPVTPPSEERETAQRQGS